MSEYHFESCKKLVAELVRRVGARQDRPFGRPYEYDEELLPNLIGRVKVVLVAFAADVKKQHGECGQPIQDAVNRLVLAIVHDELTYRFRPASEIGNLWGKVEALIENTDGRTLALFEGEKGEPFGLRAGEVVAEFDSRERKVFEVIKAMWPPERGRKKSLPELTKQCNINIRTGTPWRRFGNLKDDANRIFDELPSGVLNLQLGLGGSNVPKDTDENAWLTWVSRP